MNENHVLFINLYLNFFSFDIVWFMKVTKYDLYIYLYRFCILFIDLCTFGYVFMARWVLFCLCFNVKPKLKKKKKKWVYSETTFNEENISCECLFLRFHA